MAGLQAKATASRTSTQLEYEPYAGLGSVEKDRSIFWPDVINGFAFVLRLLWVTADIESHSHLADHDWHSVDVDVLVRRQTV